ncbi:TetR/AcrR family transcriptional regulator [Microbacterium kyungheense]|uniref:TetR family transcriptional regulator n=1 Tax=Microbacterium kyungheense TaxID=1263636 RepID=A0A543EFE5_9MICO|nr:TetR/AcrR family transcriptional regulator [Microbacterium kyungheense]TQM20312.1 TetR family transcriptional regulator [Microbacterium kyungheense]
MAADTSNAETSADSTRTYRSELRAQQAKQTRRRIVEASARLFATAGYQATTLAAIAREAGVSTETVKAAGSKAELLLAAFEVVFSGTEAADSLTETEVGEGVMALPDDAFLDAVIGQIAIANARGYALWTVVLGAAASDPIVDDALQQILARRAADYRRLVDELIRRGRAADITDPHVTAAALSFLLSPEGYQQLVAQSGWTPERYTAWTREAVLAELTH